jgi:hypothetical protein
MAKKKAAKRIPPRKKITIIVPQAIAELPAEVLERVGALTLAATSQYHVEQVEIVAASEGKFTVSEFPIHWDKIGPPPSPPPAPPNN